MTMTGERLSDYGSARMPHDWPDPETIDAADVEVIGVHHRVTYVRTVDGRELRMGSQLNGWELDNRPARDEVRVIRLDERPNALSKRAAPIRELVQIRATVVEPGTFERLQAGDKALAVRRAQATERAHKRHRTDVAELMPQLDRIPVQALGLMTDMPPAIAPLSKGARMVTTGGTPAVRGIEAIAEWLNAHGVKLEVHGGYLDVRACRMGADVREVVDVFGPLLIGHLSKQPVRCALRHVGTTPPAYTIAVGAAPVCEKHLEELDA